MFEEKVNPIQVINKIDNDMSDLFLAITDSQKEIEKLVSNTDAPEIEDIATELANAKDSLLAIHRSADDFRKKKYRKA